MHQPLFDKVMLYQELNEIIPACHQALQDMYPGVKVRWARIYGHRWAFQYGDRFDELTSIQFKINENTGVIISNEELIPEQELPVVIATLRMCLP